MKRVLLILVGLFLFVVIAGYLVVTNSGLQTSIVRSVLEGEFGDDFKLEQVRVSPGGITLRGFSLGHESGAGVDLPLAQVRISPLALLGGKLVVREVLMRDLVLDLRNVSFDPPPASPPASVGPATTPRGTPSVVTSTPEGGERPATVRSSDATTEVTEIDWAEIEKLIASLNFPDRLEVHKIALNAKILLPDNAEVTFNFEGGDLRVGQEALFTLLIEGTQLQTEDIPLDRIALTASFILKSERDGRISQFSIPHGVAVVFSDNAVTPLNLLGEFTLLNNGEELTLQHTFGEDSIPTPLLRFQTSLNPSKRSSLVELALNLSLPDWMAYLPHDLAIPLIELASDFKATVNDQNGTLVSNFALRLSEFGRVDPDFAAILPLALSSTLRSSFDTTSLSLEMANFEMIEGTDTILFRAASAQPLRLLQDEPYLELSDTTAAVFTVELKSLPLDFLAILAPEVALSVQSFTGLVNGFFDPTSNRLRLETVEPFGFQNLNLAINEEALLDSLSLVVRPSLEIQPDEAILGISHLELSHGTQVLLSYATEIVARQEGFGENSLRLTGTLTANLAQLLLQPVLASQNNLSSGLFEVNFQGEVNESVSFLAEGALKNLQNLTTRQVLPETSFSLELTASPDVPTEAIKITSGVLIAGDKNKSDLNFAASLLPGIDNSLSGTLNLKSSLIVIDDIELLASAFSPPAEDSEANIFETIAGIRDTVSGIFSPSEKKTRERPENEEPFSLAGIDLTFVAEVDRISYRGVPYLQDFRLSSRARENEIRLDTLESRLLGSVLGVNGGLLLRDDPTAPPFRVEGGLSLKDFNLGDFLRLLDPGQPPALETTLSLSGSLAADGPDIGAVLRGLGGAFSVEAGPGVLRALQQREGSGAGRLATVATGAGVVGGLLGSRQRDAGRDDGTPREETPTEAMGSVASMLREIPFESLRLSIQRDAGELISLNDLLLQGEQILLQGQGRILTAGGDGLAASPLELSLRFGAKGALARSLGRLGLVQTAPSEEEFQFLARPVTLTGSLMSPDATQFWLLLAESALQPRPQAQPQPREQAQPTPAPAAQPQASPTPQERAPSPRLPQLPGSRQPRTE